MSGTSTETRVFGQLPTDGETDDGRNYGLKEVNAATNKSAASEAKVEMFNNINEQLSRAGAMETNGHAAGRTIESMRNSQLKAAKGSADGEVAVIDVDGGELNACNFYLN